MRNALIILILLLLANRCYGVADANLVAHWTMDDNEPNTTVRDSTETYHGTAIAQTDTMHVAGQISGALDFNGVDDYVDISLAIIPLANLSQGTISFWFKVIKPPDSEWRYIFSLYDSINYTYLFIGFDSSSEGVSNLGILLIVDDGKNWTYNPLSFDVGLSEEFFNQWHFFAISHNGTRPYIYIDSQIANDDYLSASDRDLWFKSLITDAGSPAETMALGTRNGINFLDGSLDDVRIYNKALTQAEITSLYNGEAVYFLRGRSFQSTVDSSFLARERIFAF